MGVAAAAYRPSTAETVANQLSGTDTTSTVDYYNNLLASLPEQQQITAKSFMVDPNIGAGQETLAELIRRRGEYIQTSSEPYKQQLFGSMSYNNPNLETDYFNAAIPRVQQSYQQATGIENRLSGATGINLDLAEKRLMNRMNILKQEETIGSAAKQIKQRLKERDLSASLGTAGATNEVMNQAY